MSDKANERDSSLPGALTEYGGFLGCREKWCSWFCRWHSITL